MTFSLCVERPSDDITGLCADREVSVVLHAPKLGASAHLLVGTYAPVIVIPLFLGREGLVSSFLRFPLPFPTMCATARFRTSSWLYLVSARVRILYARVFHHLCQVLARDCAANFRRLQRFPRHVGHVVLGSVTFSASIPLLLSSML